MLVSAGEIRLNVVEAGQGHPVIFLPGLGGCWQDWEEQLDGLAHRYRCIAVEYRWHGRSDRPDGEITVGVLAGDLRRLCATLEIAHTHVVGLSLGGMVAQEAVSRAPDLFDSLVLVATMGRQEDTSRAVADFALTSIREFGVLAWQRAVEIALSDQGASPRGRRMIREVGGNDAEVFLRGLPAVVAHDAWDRLPGVTAPTLVVHPAGDYGVPREHSEALASRIPGARLEVMDDAGHFANVDRPAEFNRIIEDFLDHHPCPHGSPPVVSR
jgi:pimeloyl-ACP methyl ester carboxylesterase